MSWLLFNDAYLSFAFESAVDSAWCDADSDEWDAMLLMGSEL